MIVDVHTHTPRFETEIPPHLRNHSPNNAWNPAGARPLVYTWAEYEEALAPVDRAIVFNIAQSSANEELVNEPYVIAAPDVNNETARFAGSNPAKYIGFMSIHPHDPNALIEMDRCRRELGLRGVKLGLNYQNVDPLSEQAGRVFQYAEKHGLPVLLHQGTSPVRFADMGFAHPRHTDRIAMAFPNLRIIMAHIGHPFYADCLMVARKHPHVWIDISGAVLRPWGFYQAMVTAMEWGVLDRLLFASDYPASTPEETLECLRRVNDVAPGANAPRISREAIEAIIHRDSLPLLGLD